MNKKIIFLTFLIIVSFSVMSILLAIKKQENERSNVIEPNIAIMVQNVNNENQYDKWDNGTWPSSYIYQLNTTKSECEGNHNIGSYISYSSNNIIINNTSKSLKCKLYFDRQAQCFVAGTKVLAENGYVNIEDIKVGDLVWSVSEETGEKELKPVLGVIVNETTEIYEIKVGNVTIEATPRHRFYVMDKGWVRADELEENDFLVSTDNMARRKIETITHKTDLNKTKVYNLEIQDNHNYLVSTSQILVHNSKSVDVDIQPPKGPNG